MGTLQWQGQHPPPKKRCAAPSGIPARGSGVVSCVFCSGIQFQGFVGLMGGKEGICRRVEREGENPKEWEGGTLDVWWGGRKNLLSSDLLEEKKKAYSKGPKHPKTALLKGIWACWKFEKTKKNSKRNSTLGWEGKQQGEVWPFIQKTKPNKNLVMGFYFQLRTSPIERELSRKTKARALRIATARWPHGGRPGREKLVFGGVGGGRVGSHLALAWPFFFKHFLREPKKNASRGGRHKGGGGEKEMARSWGLHDLGAVSSKKSRTHGKFLASISQGEMGGQGGGHSILLVLQASTFKRFFPWENRHIIYESPNWSETKLVRRWLDQGLGWGILDSVVAKKKKRVIWMGSRGNNGAQSKKAVVERIWK